jgi:hypothetical protein
MVAITNAKVCNVPSMMCPKFGKTSRETLNDSTMLFLPTYFFLNLVSLNINYEKHFSKFTKLFIIPSRSFSDVFIQFNSFVVSTF